MAYEVLGTIEARTSGAYSEASAVKEDHDREGRVEEVARREDVEHEAVLVVAWHSERIVARELRTEDRSVLCFVHFSVGWRFFWCLKGDCTI